MFECCRRGEICFSLRFFLRVYGNCPSPPVLKSRNSTSHIETRANPPQNLSLANASNKRRRRSLARRGIVATVETPALWADVLLGGARPCRRSTGPSMHAGQCQRADIARCQLTDRPTIRTLFFANLSKDCRIVSSRGNLCRNIAAVRCAPFRLQKCPRCRGFAGLEPAEHGPQLNGP